MSLKTYVITGSSSNVTQTIISPELDNYGGFLWLISGKGGSNTTSGGNAGFVNSGYTDFTYPYTFDKTYGINVLLGATGISNLSYKYTDSPGGGTGYVVFNADQGNSSSGFFLGANNTSSVSQRGVTGTTSSEGYLTNDYGASLLGGGGFYGGTTGASGPTGPFGYSSGTYDNTGSPAPGYAVITLIPSSIESNVFFEGVTGAVGVTGIHGVTGLNIYSILGGGGGGAGGAGNRAANGGAGGGGGVFKSGFFQVNSSTNINYTIGQGGTGGTIGVVNPGGNDNINGDSGYNSSLIFGNENIISIGGEGGINGYVNFNPISVGGRGYFGGGAGIRGSGSTYYGYPESMSYINIPSYNGEASSIGGNTLAGNGAGFVFGDNNIISGGTLLGYGQGANANGGGIIDYAGGGGGGLWGGNGGFYTSSIQLNATSASGYGSGGGGSASTSQGYGGNGSGGYVLMKTLNTTNLKFYKIITNTKFTYSQFYLYTGFWFFLDGDTGFNAFDTGHFLINPDGVGSIQFTKTSGYWNINVTFDTKINNKTQVFSLKASSPQNYCKILFYK